MMNSEHLATILEVGHLLAAETSLEALPALILEKSRQVLDAERSTLYLVEVDGAALRSQIAQGMDGQTISLARGQGLAGSVALTGETINLADAYADPRFDPTIDQEHGYRTRTILTVPMRNRQGTIIGVLQTLNKRHGSFTSEDAELLRRLGESASIAIENARLLAAVRQQERAQRDLEIARTIQMNLLPTQLPILSAVTVAASCVPALEVGGDLYDITTLDDGTTIFTVADVSGKGVPAALFMGMVRTALRTESVRAASLGELLAICNRVLYDDLSGANMFVTIFVAAIDARGESLRYANGGHCRALLRRAATGAIKFLVADGLPLGILEEAVYADDVTALQPDDVVILYSDGLVEAAGPPGPEGVLTRYGLDRLGAVVQRAGELPPEALHQQILEDVAAFSGDQPQLDDQALVIIRVRGTTP